MSKSEMKKQNTVVNYLISFQKIFVIFTEKALVGLI